MEAADSRFGYSPSRLGLIVQRLRDKEGWTQVELAEDAGVSREVIAHLEQGKRRVFLDLVVKVAAALRVPVALLLACAQTPPTELKHGMLCLLVLLPHQKPLLVGHVVRRTPEGYRVRLDGAKTTISVHLDEVRALP